MLLQFYFSLWKEVFLKAKFVFARRLGQKQDAKIIVL